MWRVEGRQGTVLQVSAELPTEELACWCRNDMVELMPAVTNWRVFPACERCGVHIDDACVCA